MYMHKIEQMTTGAISVIRENSVKCWNSWRLSERGYQVAQRKPTVKHATSKGCGGQACYALLHSLSFRTSMKLWSECGTHRHIIFIIIHEFHHDASLETKLQGCYVSRITLQL